MRGKPNSLHSNTDTAEAGQVPNVSQLDPAQTQTNRQADRQREEKVEKRGIADLALPQVTSSLKDTQQHKHLKERSAQSQCEVGMQQTKEPIIHFEYDALQMI